MFSFFCFRVSHSPVFIFVHVSFFANQVSVVDVLLTCVRKYITLDMFLRFMSFLEGSELLVFRQGVSFLLHVSFE